jgi:uncharacterized SAM-binding protein YcdF (DUF218 family)
MEKKLTYCITLIQWMWERGFKTYITKGTGYSKFIPEDKAIILDLASPNFYKNAETSKKIVQQLWIKEQIKKAKKAV